MSVVHSIKEHLGLVDEPHRYECNECGSEFETRTDPDSRWLRCSECESEDVRIVERAEQA